MIPLEAYSGWDGRDSSHGVQMSYKYYFVICEGENTEPGYFQALDASKRELGLHNLIKIITPRKTGKDRGASHPEKLVALAKATISNGDIKFRKNDKILIVFDADAFQDNEAGYQSILSNNAAEFVLGITNPSFELFLLLHRTDAVARLIKPDEAAILANIKIGKRRYIAKKVSKEFRINSKNKSQVKALVKDVHIAIEQEKLINQDINRAIGKITSNIGQIIESIMNGTL